MAFTKLTPNLIVDDVLDTVHFWCDVLGFEFVLGVAAGTQDAVFERRETPLGFAMLKSGDTEIMFQTPESLRDDLASYRPSVGGDAFTIFIEVDDVETMRERVGEQAEIAQEMRDTFYGMREFHVRDNNGIIVGFAQRAPAD